MKHAARRKAELESALALEKAEMYMEHNNKCRESQAQRSDRRESLETQFRKRKADITGELLRATQKSARRKSELESQIDATNYVLASSSIRAVLGEDPAKATPGGPYRNR